MPSAYQINRIEERLLNVYLNQGERCGVSPPVPMRFLAHQRQESQITGKLTLPARPVCLRSEIGIRYHGFTTDTDSFAGFSSESKRR